MSSIYRIPETLEDDLNRYREATERYKQGAVSSVEFRSIRVPMGVYEQREDGTFMLRVRLVAGCLLPDQMRAVAKASRKYGNGVLHVTTRQDIQIHGVSVDNVYPALVDLFAAGLSTKGGGGNTVRNITGCCRAGVCREEMFDVTPYAVSLTEFMLPDPLSFRLPRKYKIAFSGCSKDCAGATINDLGFIAKKRGDRAGFAVYVGGGMGGQCRVGDLLEGFVPAEDIYTIAEAVKRVFDKYGNRKNKYQARLRFLVERLGLGEFRRLYREELSKLKKPDIEVPSTIGAQSPQSWDEVSAAPISDGFDVWKKNNTDAQKQAGFHLVHIPLLLGDVAADKLEQLSGLVESYGEGMVRATQSQHFILRWIRSDDLPSVYAKLSDIGLADSSAPIIRGIVACAGASTCRLGLCLSRGLAKAISDRLMGSDLDLDGMGNVKINISGCPNCCGRHPIADIGLFGAARRIEGHLAPHYTVQLGGKVGEGRTTLAKGDVGISAGSVPAFVEDLLKAFRTSATCPDFGAFLEAEGRGRVEALIEKYRRTPTFDEDKNHYFDWGSDSLFSLAGRGPGECSAGVFDLIEVDLKSAQDAFAENRLLEATVLAARALLVTQGEEAKDETTALDLFDKLFIGNGLVDASFRDLVGKAKGALPKADRETVFDIDPATVGEFVNTVRNLYDNMDDSLRFKPQKAEEPCSLAQTSVARTKVDKETDLKGVACPLNYVRTKLALEAMKKGDILAVLLGDDGAKNVPDSAKKDGHEIVSVEREGNHWRVIIRN